MTFSGEYTRESRLLGDNTNTARSWLPGVFSTGDTLCFAVFKHALVDSPVLNTPVSYYFPVVDTARSYNN